MKWSHTRGLPLANHSDLCFEHDLFAADTVWLTCYLGKTLYATKINFISTDTNKHRIAFDAVATHSHGAHQKKKTLNKHTMHIYITDAV